MACPLVPAGLNQSGSAISCAPSTSFCAAIALVQAIEKLFGKKVIAVRTCNFFGKARRERKADYGRTNHWKKAIVRLKVGEKIDLV